MFAPLSGVPEVSTLKSSWPTFLLRLKTYSQIYNTIPAKTGFFFFCFQDYSNKVAIFQFWSKNVAWKWSWDQTRLIPNRTNITSCSLMFCFSEIRDGVMWTLVDFSISSPWLSVCSSRRRPLVLVSLNDESLLWLTFHAPDISTFFLWSSLQFLAYSHISLSEDICRKSDHVTYCLSSQTFLWNLGESLHVSAAFCKHKTKSQGWGGCLSPV